MLHYKTNAGKLRSVQSGMKFHTLTPARPFKDINIHLKSSSKFSNPYMALFVMIHVPQSDSFIQIPMLSETTAAQEHLQIKFTTRYDEYHQDFDFQRQ